MIGRRLRPNEVRRLSFYRSPGPKSGIYKPWACIPINAVCGLARKQTDQLSR
jgi:hypothetical protein